MKTAIQTILASLDGIFAAYDAQVKADAIAWGLKRAAAVRAFAASEEAWAMRSQKNGEWAYYAKVHAMAGGKTWYNVFHGRSEAKVVEFMENNHEATIAKRNAMIANKLVGIGVTSVVSEEYVRTADGFNGVFVVQTDAGRKAVTVNTIKAGGWNIQCFHQRVLVKVSK